MTATTSALTNGLPRSVMQRISDAYRAFREARRQRWAVREMRCLDSRTLKDIGIDRSEILSLVHGDPNHRIRKVNRTSHR